MIVVDAPYPESCTRCTFMRCGICIALSGTIVEEEADAKTKPDFCPVVCEVEKEDGLWKPVRKD